MEVPMRLIGFPIMKTVVLVLVSGVASSALAFKEPDGFQGVPWGATEDALRDKLGETSAHGILFAGCGSYTPEQRWMGDRSCSGAFPLGDITVHAVYTFRANRFFGVNLTFPSRDFARVADIFIERYGPPTSSVQESYKTRGGLAATNQINRWAGSKVAITLRRYGSQISDGLGSITTRAELEESARLWRELAKGAAKGL